MTRPVVANPKLAFNQPNITFQVMSTFETFFWAFCRRSLAALPGLSAAW